MSKTGLGEDKNERYQVRALQETDIGNGLLDTLKNLSDLEGLKVADARRVLRRMKRAGLYHTFVAVEPSGQVIGATTLLVEQKFIHRGGLVGHIEDVVVRKGHEGKGVGSSLVKEAIEKAKEFGCYKCILDCKEGLVGFYEALGLKRRDVGMRIDLKPTLRGAGREATKGYKE